MPYLYQSGFAAFICLGVLPPYVWCAASVCLGVLPPSGHIASIRRAVSVWLLCLWGAVSVCEELSVLLGAMCQADQRHLSQTLELCMLRWTWETGDFAAPLLAHQYMLPPFYWLVLAFGPPLVDLAGSVPAIPHANLAAPSWQPPSSRPLTHASTCTSSWLLLWAESPG